MLNFIFQILQKLQWSNLTQVPSRDRNLTRERKNILDFSLRLVETETQ